MRVPCARKQIKGIFTESRQIATQIKGFYLLRLAGMLHLSSPSTEILDFRYTYMYMYMYMYESLVIQIFGDLPNKGVT